MQQSIVYSKTTLVSTLCGTVLSVFNSISTEDLVKTAVLAALGATVSFLVSVSLKLLLRRLSGKK